MTDDSGKIKSIARELIALQDSFNQRIRADWINAGFKFHRAIWMEGAELMESTPWKWWKKGGEINLPQLQLEIIDKIHFLISWAMVDAARQGLTSDDVHADICRFLSKCDFEAELWDRSSSAVDIDKLQDTIERVVSTAAAINFGATLHHLAAAAGAMGMDASLIRRMYVAKNALNTVRNMLGYKEGSYIKVWDGEEDNVHLERLMEDQPNLSLTQIVDTLCGRYRALAQGA